MEVRDDHTTQTETKISNGLEDVLYELNLFDVLQKLPDETHTRDGNAIATIDDELTCDNEIFGDLLRKIKVFRDKVKEEKSKNSDFILEWKIFNDFLNLMEKHEKNLTDEDLLVLKRGLKLFVDDPDNVDPDNVLTTDLDYCKKIFYMFFSLFNTSIIQNYFKNVETPDQLRILYRPCISRILIVMTYTCKLADLGLDDLQRPIYCHELLSSMLNYVETNFESSDLTSHPFSTDQLILNLCILSFMLWYGDKTILIPDLMKIGCSEIMIDILKMICKTPEIHTDLQLFVVVIIYNISRHDDGVKQLNNLHTSEIIKAFQSTNQNVKINIACYTTLVLLATPEEIKNDSKRMNDVLDKLLEKVYNASVSSDHRADGELHLSELLIVFVKLFNDDRTLNYIMEHSKVDLHAPSTTEFFINQLLYYYFEISDQDPLKQATCTALVNILWSVSFQEKYKQQLKGAGTKFKELIQNLATRTDQKVSPNQYVPSYIENIQKAATGLLFNIDELTHSASGASTVLDENQNPTIMISYSHEDSEFCKQLYNEILRRGYDIWIDFKFLKTGDLWEQIAAGMKRANVIICLMSEDYCKSKSCRWEATYALDKLQATKSIIPVFLRKHELPDWLEIRTAVLKYVRFRDLKQLENDRLCELIDMIQYSLPPTVRQQDLNLHPRVLPIHHEPSSVSMTKFNNKPTLHNNYHDESTEAKPIVTTLENQDISSKRDPVLRTTTDQTLYPEKPIEQWNQNDVSQWFQQNNILTELRDLCRFQDGYELIDYAEIFRDTKKLQYQLYSNEFLRRNGITFGQRPLLLHEFTKFSNALRKLENKK